MELISAMNDSQLSDLALTFSVARPTLNGVHDISLRGDGCEEVTEANVKEFARLRSDGRFGRATNKNHRCSGQGLPRRRAWCCLLLLESPEELREALAGVEALDVQEWRRETKLRGAFKDAPSHKVVEWFWAYVASLDPRRRRSCSGGPRGPRGVLLEGSRSCTGGTASCGPSR